MQTRGILGKRIVAIRQRRFYNHHLGAMDLDVNAIILEDGTELRPVVGETDGEYVVDLVIAKAKR